MHISDVHEYGDSDERQEVVDKFIAEGRKKQIKSVLEELIDDEFDRLEEYANEYISQTAAYRAERFLTKVLNGDEEAAMELLGDKHSHDRYKTLGADSGKPWCHLIHGNLFETGGIRLRREIVEAHATLLKNERIADLESVVDGLSQQVRVLEAELSRCRESINHHLDS